MSSQFCVMLRLLLSSSLAAGSSMNSAAALGATFSFYFYSCIWICLFCKFLVWVCVFFVITNSFCWFVDKWVIFTCSFDEIYFLSSLVLDHRWCVIWSFIWGKKILFFPLVWILMWVSLFREICLSGNIPCCPNIFICHRFHSVMSSLLTYLARSKWII